MSPVGEGEGDGLKGAQFRSAPYRNRVASSLGWRLAGGEGAGRVLPSILCLGRGSALGLRVGRVEMLRVG